MVPLYNTDLNIHVVAPNFFYHRLLRRNYCQGDKKQFKTLFLAIFDQCLSIVKSIFDCCLSGVIFKTCYKRYFFRERSGSLVECLT